MNVHFWKNVVETMFSVCLLIFVGLIALILLLLFLLLNLSLFVIGFSIFSYILFICAVWMTKNLLVSGVVVLNHNLRPLGLKTNLFQKGI